MLKKKAYSPIGTWEGFVRALQIRFGSTAFDDLMETLTRLRQTSSIASFNGQFEALSNRIKRLSEKHKLFSHWIEG